MRKKFEACRGFKLCVENRRECIAKAIILQQNGRLRLRQFSYKDHLDIVRNGAPGSWRLTTPAYILSYIVNS